MKLTSKGKLNKLTRRVTSLALCLTVLIVTCVFDLGTADAAEPIMGWEWTRIYSTSEMQQWNSRIDKGDVRVLITYSNDRFYIGEQNDDDGAMYGKLTTTKMKLDRSTFTSLRDFNAPIITRNSGDIGDWDGNNNCGVYNIRFTDAAGNGKNLWLYHENAIFPFIWKGFFTFYPSMWDHQEDDEVPFTITSDRWDEHSIMFSSTYNNFNRKDFLNLVAKTYFQKNYDEIDDDDANKAKCDKLAEKYIKTVSLINGCMESYGDDAGYQRAVAALRADYPKQENTYAYEFVFEDYLFAEKNKKDHEYDPNKEEEKEAFAAECKRLKEAYLKMKVGNKTLKQCGKLGGDDWNDGEAEIFYNIPKRLDTSWRSDGSQVYDSWSWGGSAGSYKIFLGVKKAIPTVTTSGEVGPPESDVQEVQQKYGDASYSYYKTRIINTAIAEGVVIKVNKGSTLIIEDDVICEGILEVYGNLIIEDESILADMRDAATGAKAKWHNFNLSNTYYNDYGEYCKDEWKGNIPNCEIHLYPGATMYIAPRGAVVQYKNSNLIIDEGATLICDGTLITSAGVTVNGTLEVGPSSEVALGAYPTDDIDGVFQLLKGKTIYDSVIADSPRTYDDGKRHQDLHIGSKGVLKAYGTCGIYRHSTNAGDKYQITIDNPNAAHIVCYEGVAKDISQALSGFAFYVRNQYVETYVVEE